MSVTIAKLISKVASTFDKKGRQVQHVHNVGLDGIVSPGYNVLHLTAADPTAGGTSDVTLDNGDLISGSNLQGLYLAHTKFYVPMRDAGFGNIVVGLGSDMDSTISMDILLSLGKGLSTNEGVGTIQSSPYLVFPEPSLYRPDGSGAPTRGMPGSPVVVGTPGIALSFFSEDYPITTGSIELYIYRW